MMESGIPETSARVSISAPNRIRRGLSVLGSGYDAFISYTQSEPRDIAFARALKRGLERLAKPWFRRRALTRRETLDRHIGGLYGWAYAAFAPIIPDPA